MNQSDFVTRFGGIYEHSSWVAERAEEYVADHSSAAAVGRAMADCVDNASHEMQLALIRAHPDLAGKAQIAGELTIASTGEQASAGLDHCTPEEYRLFQESNERYKEKFGFPFVMAVKDSDRAKILASFAERLQNSYAEELETAIVEIHKIARLRLEAMDL